MDESAKAAGQNVARFCWFVTINAAVFTNSSSTWRKSGHLGEWAARREILPEPTPGPIVKSARRNPRGHTIRTGDLQ
jgi:hypothetical protein